MSLIPSLSDFCVYFPPHRHISYVLHSTPITVLHFFHVNFAHHPLLVPSLLFLFASLLAGHQGATYREGSGLGATRKAVTYTGNGTSTDIIVASARAYLSAINRLLDRKH